MAISGDAVSTSDLLKRMRTMQQVCHSERSATKSKNLRTYRYIRSKNGARILRLPSVAQDDTVISAVLHMKADNRNWNLSNSYSYCDLFTYCRNEIALQRLTAVITVFSFEYIRNRRVSVI